MKFDVNDIVGKKFDKLTVLRFDHKEQKYCSNGIKNGFNYFYLCKCDCNNISIVSRRHLITGHTKSCGCNNYTHNLTYTRLYNIYSGMKQRCYNPKRLKYKVYGGRGIKICDEWLNDFKVFYDWSMQNGYKDNLTIDRIDVNGNYEPSNCRWITNKEQENNRSNNHLLTFNDEIHTINEWAEKLNIKRETIKTRLALGWSIEKALFTPVRNRNRQ